MINYEYEDGLILLKQQRENLGQIMESLNQIKPRLKATENYLEIHLINYLFQLSSIEVLARGTRIFPTIEGEFIDLSSFYVLTRAVIENYFTIHYLYFEPSNDFELSKFRYWIYHIHGLNIRQNLLNEIPPNSEDYIKIQNEKIVLQDYISELEKNTVFLALDHKKQKALRKGRPPRDISYTQLISKSYFGTSMFKHTWEHLCNFAHTESVSIIQLNTIFTKPESLQNTPSLIRLYVFGIIMLTSSLFVNLNKRFPEVNAKYETLSAEFRLKNEVWFKISQSDIDESAI